MDKDNFRTNDYSLELLCNQKELLVFEPPTQQLNDELNEEILKNLNKSVRELDNDNWIFEKKYQSSSSSSSSTSHNSSNYSNQFNNNITQSQHHLLNLDSRVNQNDIRRYNSNFSF